MGTIQSLPGHGRKIALLSLAAGILVAAWAARDGLVEAWYVHRLRSSRNPYEHPEVIVAARDARRKIER